MVSPRVVEMDHEKIGERAVKSYNESMRHLRDKCRLQTELLLKSRIDLGCALEIGPGPGYEGLEWLRKTDDTILKGLDTSEEMVYLARKNAQDYGLAHRAEYFVGDAGSIPFADSRFDAVFSINSLHKWHCPKKIFDEIFRVLRPGGRYFISDLRRDMNPLMSWFIRLNQPGKPEEIRSGFVKSVNASYTLPEIRDLLAETKLRGWKVEKTPIRVVISGRKEYNLEKIPVSVIIAH